MATKSNGKASSKTAATAAVAESPTIDDDDNLNVFVQNLLQQMQGRFQQMSDTIVNRIDDMGSRIDDLERSIGDLMAQAGISGDDREQSAAMKESLSAPNKTTNN